MSVKNLTFVNNNPPPCDDEFLNSVKNEINNNTTSSGQSLTGIGDTQQTAKASANYAASGAFYGCTNTGDAYTLTPISPFQGITGYKDGQLFRFRPSATNTTQSPTINVNGQGVKNITKADGSTQVDIGDIDTNQDIELRYDLGNDVFVIPKLKSTSLIPTLYIGGISTENDAGDTDHDIKFNIGSCRDIADTQDIILASALVKQLDAVWTAGTGLGGRASAFSLSANTTYHMFVIAKPDGTVDAGFDTALNAVNLLSDATGYTKYRRVASMDTDSSSNWVQYNQKGNLFRFKDMDRTPDLSLTPASAISPTNLTVSSPFGIRLECILMVELRFGVAGQNNRCYVAIWNDALTDPTSANATNSIASVAEGTSGDHGATVNKVVELTNTTGQVRYRLDADDFTSPSNLFKITTQGWYDYFLD